MDHVTIRMFDGGTDRFLELYDRSYGVERSRAWFDWKYATNPFVDEPPIVVAECDGDLVGAIPAIPVPLSMPHGRVTALQPTDIMVDPAYRNQGVFTAMAEWTVDRYTDSEYGFLLGYPNRQSLPGWTKTGWAVVGTVPKYTRLQELPFDPSSIGGRPVGSIARVLGNVTLGMANRLARPFPRVDGGEISSITASDVDWTAHETGSDPGRITANRSASYYRWRCGKPAYSYRVYHARSHDTSAAVLVSTADDPADSTVRILDILPHHGPTASQRAQIRAIISSLCRKNREQTTITAPNALAEHLFAPETYNFLRTTSFPLSVVSAPAPLIVRHLRPDDRAPWRLDGLDIRNPEHWNADLIERDLY